MPIDTTDVADVRTLSVARLSQAPRLAGAAFVTPWFRMDPDRADAFHTGTYMDSYPHPYADEGYGDDLVEGYHLLGMLDVLLNHAIWSDAPYLAWNYGLDHVRFVSVVRYRDRWRLRGAVTDVIDRGEQGYLLVLDIVGEVEGRDRPGFVATQRLLWTAGGAESGADSAPAASAEAR